VVNVISFIAYPGIFHGVFIVSCKTAIKVIKLPLLLVGSPTLKKAQNSKLRSIMDNIHN